MLAALMFTLLFQNANSDLSINERFRVEFVLLDVVAFDRKNNLITDLTAEEFEIEENGEPVEITFFDTLDFRNLSEPDFEDIPEEYLEQVKSTQIQQVILAIDFFGMNNVDSKKVHDRLQAFVEELEPEIDYRVNVFSLERGSITKGFTQDREQIRIAITDTFERHLEGMRRERGGYRDQGLSMNWDGDRRAGNYRRPGSRGVSMLGDNNIGFDDLERSFRDCRSLFSGNRGGVEQCISETMVEYIDLITERTNAIIGQLEIMTYAFEDVGGLKTMMFISPGFALNNISSVIDLANAYRPGGNGRDAFMGTGLARIDPRTDFRRVIHACIKNRVIFHTFDIFHGSAGFRRQGDLSMGSGVASSQIVRAYRSFSFDITDGLRSLATESGGSFNRVNNLKGPINKVLERNRFFYVIGYTSPIGDEVGEFREIEVDVNRRRVKVRHRTGYFAGVDKRL